MNVASLRSSEAQNTSTECKLAKVALMTISLWFMAWTPYLVINFTGVFETAQISPLATIWGSLFAKANAVYNVSHLHVSVNLQCLNLNLFFVSSESICFVGISQSSTVSAIRNIVQHYSRNSHRWPAAVMRPIKVELMLNRLFLAQQLFQMKNRHPHKCIQFQWCVSFVVKRLDAKTRIDF